MRSRLASITAPRVHNIDAASDLSIPGRANRAARVVVCESLVTLTHGGAGAAREITASFRDTSTKLNKLC